MDWLDQYLNGLGDYKTTVSPADTHMWGVKPKLNNIQERMQFDAAAQSEVEYRQLVQEARAELEAQGGGMSVDDVQAGIGADPGSPTVQTTSTPAAAFPVSISIEGVNLYGNTGNLNSVSQAGFFDESGNVNAPYNETEMSGILRSPVPPYKGVLPFRLYANFIANGNGGYDYIYMGYLLWDLAGYYSGGSIAPGRWFIGNGWSFSNDNTGCYTNYGYYTALQSNSTLPSTNIANWTRISGYNDQSGNISSITFNY
jgi:hypothetical protein